MKVKFVGATDGITGSCTWLNHVESGCQWLVDCGMYQGPNSMVRNDLPFPFNPAEITGVLLTHAHIDHCGLIPRLYKEGFRGQVHCTEATAAIARIQLQSAIKHLSTPIYSEEDVDAIQWQPFDTDERFNWGKSVALISNVKITPMRGSHMLGSCAIQVSWKVSENSWRNMLFTGDVGNNTEDHTQFPMLKGNHAAFPTADYIMIESTYGSRVREEDHKSMESRHAQLWRIIDSTVNTQGGKVIIPAFAAQRAQDIALDIIIGLCSGQLRKASGKPLKLLMHSPSIARLNHVYGEQLEKSFWSRKGQKKQYMNEALQGLLNPQEIKTFINLLKATKNADGQLFAQGDFKYGVVYVSSDPDYPLDDIDIILASSGMAEGGYVTKHIDCFQHQAHNTILFTGYQAFGTRGASLVDAPYQVVAAVENMSPYYSGHADQSILLDYVFDLGRFDQTGSTTIFLNHGEHLAKGSLLEAITTRKRERLAFDRRLSDVIIPNNQDGWFDLDRDCFEKPDTDGLLHQIKILKRQLEQHQTNNMN